jgi:hypothetical protein
MTNNITLLVLEHHRPQRIFDIEPVRLMPELTVVPRQRSSWAGVLVLVAVLALYGLASLLADVAAQL